MAGPELIDRDLGMKAFRRWVVGLSDDVLYIGIPEANALRTKGPADVTNVEVGVANEFGAPARRIPERAWLRSAFDQHEIAWFRQVRRVIGATSKGRIPSVREMWTKVGKRAARDVRRGIRQGEGIPPPNAIKTAVRKGHDHTLIGGDLGIYNPKSTAKDPKRRFKGGYAGGQMLRAITYVIRKRK
jgi:hypothetical protein